TIYKLNPSNGHPLSSVMVTLGGVAVRGHERARDRSGNRRVVGDLPRRKLPRRAASGYGESDDWRRDFGGSPPIQLRGDRLPARARADVRARRGCARRRSLRAAAAAVPASWQRQSGRLPKSLTNGSLLWCPIEGDARANPANQRGLLG